MSDFSYQRALTLRVIQAMSPPEKELFKAEVRNELGVPADQDCDKVCSKLSEDEFKAMVERIKAKLKKRVGQTSTEEKEAVNIYA